MSFSDSVSSTQPSAQSVISDKILQWTKTLLITMVWVSAGLFGLYILAFYAAPLAGGNLDKWNDLLPNLYREGDTAATSGIGLHFAAGGIILILGSIQLIDAVRNSYPAFHRWVGRVYVVACLLAAVGGLTFIFVKGTIGGTVMDIGFGLYGVLMFIAGIQTYRHAAARRIDLHRVWALRLYALAIGSWLYRMDYGFWFSFTDRLGHTEHFTGLFDRVMAFFFYLPNLLVVELFVRSQKANRTALYNYGVAFILLLTTGFLGLGTYYFTKLYWGPAIVGWLMA